MMTRLPGVLGLCLLTACASAGGGLTTGSGIAQRQQSQRLREVRLPGDLRMAPSQAIIDLPSDRTYRFVSPDSLLQRTTSEDVRSAEEATATDLATALSIVLEAHGWRESPDSADYDISVFIASRTGLRTETHQVVAGTGSSLPRCDTTRGQPTAAGSCQTGTAVSRTERRTVPENQRFAYHVIRRRSDGAMRVGVDVLLDAELVKASKAKDLIRLLVAGESR